MNTKVVFASLVTVGMVTSATAARAEVEIGAEALVVPSGEITIENDDVGGGTGESAVAYGVSGLVDVVLGQYLSVGFAPRYIMNIKGEDLDEDADGASQLDLAVRITGRAPIGEKVDVFLYGAPGYSIIFLPDDPILDEIDSPQGLAIGVGGGAKFKVAPNLAVVGEVGYTFGFQSTTVLDQDVDAQTDLLHVGLGLQAVL